MQNQNEAHEIGQTNLEERGDGEASRIHCDGKEEGNSKDRPILQRWWPGDRGEELVKKWTKL